MPMMELTYLAGALEVDATETLPETLTTILLRAEKAPDTPVIRSVTWTYLRELPAQAVLVADRPSPTPTFRLEVTVPEGVLSDRRKQLLVEQATEAILAAAHLGADAAPFVWVFITEITDGNWGAGGRIVTFADLIDLAASERSGSSTQAKASTGGIWDAVPVAHRQGERK